MVMHEAFINIDFLCVYVRLCALSLIAQIPCCERFAAVSTDK